MIQLIENLPDELLSQPRWFKIFGKDKPQIKDWSNPANQRPYTEIETGNGYFAAFDISGHDAGDDYLVVDFDHVLDDDGNWVNDDAQKWYNCLASSVDTYCELSCSKHGLHFAFKPRKGEFFPMASGREHSLIFDDTGKVKIELFYMTGGRYIFFTGDVYNCAPKIPIATDCDAIYLLLDEIRKRNPETPRQTKSDRYTGIDLDKLQKALDTIQFDGQFTYQDWIYTGMAIHADVSDNDAAFTIWRNFSARDTRLDGRGKPQFNESKMRYFWEHFNGNRTDENKVHVGTIFNIAKRYGYQPPKPKNNVDEAKALLDDLINNGLPKDKINTPEIIHACAVLKVYSPADWNNFYEALEGVVNRNNFFAAVNKESKPIRRKYWEEVHNNKRDKATATAKKNIDELAKLKAQPPTPERDKAIIAVINNLADWKRDRFTDTPIKIKTTYKNASLIFDNDPLLDGLFGYDEFARYQVFLKMPYWRKGGSVGDKVENDDDAHIRLYLRDNYGEFSDEKLVADCITVYAHKQTFHPVKKYLERLKWDGVPRAETLFIDFLGVDDTEYSRTITTNWLMGAVARLYAPGCEYQTALVLQGVQGIGKSYITEMLGGKWHIKLTDSLDDSHAVDAIKSAWIAEIEEWTAGRKADINAAKSFISRGFDTRRGAYERREEKTPRHCVFVVTVNDTQFLRDQTGNRRFAILECRNAPNQIKKILTQEHVDQVWAEVLLKYTKLMKDGFSIAKLRLPDEITLQAENIADRFLLDDGLATEIKAFLDTPIPARPIWVMMTRTERRKFFEDGSILLYLDDLHHRFQSLPEKWRNDPQFNQEFDDALNNAKEIHDKKTPDTATKSNIVAMRWYGTRYREYICAAEIYNECFGIDRRKSMSRINEVLDKLDGWTQGARLRNVDPQYSDMKKAYYRDSEETDTAPVDTKPQNVSDDNTDDSEKYPF